MAMNVRSRGWRHFERLSSYGGNLKEKAEQDALVLG